MLSSCTGVRIALLGAFALLAVGLTFSEVRSQPPGFPGPKRPNFPGPPTMPGPSFPGGGPNAGFPSGPPGGLGGGFVDVYSCGKCKRELGRGTKPNLSSCPYCGVRFLNGGGGGSPPPGGFSSPPPSGVAPAAPAVDFDLEPRQVAGGSDPDTGDGSFTAPPSSSPAASSRSGPSSSTDTAVSADTGSKTGNTVLKIMLIVFGVLFLAAIIGGIVLFVMANRATPTKKKPKRKQKAYDLDDDED